MSTPFEWTMKDGTKIRATDMSDAHLANTLRMLQRKLVKIAALTNFQSVLIAMSCKNDDLQDEVMTSALQGAKDWSEVQDKSPAFCWLKAEAKSRGLYWDTVFDSILTKLQNMYETKFFLDWVKAKELNQHEQYMNRLENDTQETPGNESDHH